MIRRVVLAASIGLGACATAPPQPNNAPPLGDNYADFLIGRVASLHGDYAAAAEHFQAALARSPQDEDLLERALGAALAAGDADRARQIARLAPANTLSVYAELVRSVDAISAGHWRDAQSELAAAHGGAAEQLMAAMLAVWANAGEGRISAVSDDLAPLLGVPPYSGLLYAQQAMAYDFAGRNPEALSAYAAAADGGLWLAPAILRRADLMARTGAHDQAEALLGEPVYAANPELAAAGARLRAGASAALTPITPAKGAAVGLYGLATIYAQQSDFANALAALTLSLMLDPGLDEAKLAFADAQTRLGNNDAAVRALHSLADTSDYASSAHIMEAWTLVGQNRGDAAVALVQQAAAAGDGRAARALGDIYRALHRDDQAEAQFSALIALNPDDWRLYFARGAVRVKLHRVEAGEADLQHALAISPDQPEVLNYLGYSWVDRGVRLPEALAMIERALALRPDSGPIADSLGWAYFRMRDYRRAVEALEHAVELDPGDGTLNAHLGDAYWRAGRRLQARYQWRHALAQAPDDAGALQAKIDHGLGPETATRGRRQ